MRTRGWSALIVLALLAPAIWWALHPRRSDPGNLHYQLWKAGILPMDLDQALGTLAHADPGRDRFLLGCSEAELHQKFGTLTLPAQAGPFLRQAFAASPWRDSQARFLRNSPLLVVFKNGKAAEIVLIKGA